MFTVKSLFIITAYLLIIEHPRGPKKSSIDGAGLPSSWHFVTFSLYFSTLIRLSKYQLFSCESMPHVIYAGSGSIWLFDEDADDDDGFELFDVLNELLSQNVRI